MKRFVTVYLILVLIIAGILFKDLVINLFRGMTPLEAMKQIITFMLHVTVITILAYVLFGFHAIIEGWIKFWRKVVRPLFTGWSSFATKRRRPPLRVRVAGVRSPRRTQDPVLRALQIMTLMGKVQPPTQAKEKQTHARDDSHINF